jgi:hypothetical protein
MRTNTDHIEDFRNTTHPDYKSDKTYGMNGFFVIPISERDIAMVIASSGDLEAMPWEHVSVRIGEKHNKKLKERIATWEEMCLVREIFWGDDECVMQLHPPLKDYVNVHPFVLHLWKPLHVGIPQPPTIAV